MKALCIILLSVAALAVISEGSCTEVEYSWNVTNGWINSFLAHQTSYVKSDAIARVAKFYHVPKSDVIFRKSEWMCSVMLSLSLSRLFCFVNTLDSNDSDISKLNQFNGRATGSSDTNRWTSRLEDAPPSLFTQPRRRTSTTRSVYP